MDYKIFASNLQISNISEVDALKIEGYKSENLQFKDVYFGMITALILNHPEYGQYISHRKGLIRRKS